MGTFDENMCRYVTSGKPVSETQSMRLEVVQFLLNNYASLIAGQL